MEKKNNKGLIVAVVILVLLVIGLGGYIVYDKVIMKESEEPEKVEKKEEDNTLKEPNYDLSNIPQTSPQCTFEFTLSEYNKLVENLGGEDNTDDINKYKCDNELYKYIIKDVVLDNTKQNVQLVGGTMDYLYQNSIDKDGVYINGVKHEALNDATSVDLDIRRNMLFVVTDSGTAPLGYVNVLAFDKNGTEKYNLSKVLEQEQITDTNANKDNQETKIINTGSILRSSVKIDDNTIKFKTYTTEGSTCVNGYRGSIYSIKYNANNFDKPIYENGWRTDNDNCTEVLN